MEENKKRERRKVKKRCGNNITVRWGEPNRPFIGLAAALPPPALTAREVSEEGRNLHFIASFLSSEKKKRRGGDLAQRWVRSLSLSTHSRKVVVACALLVHSRNTSLDLFTTSIVVKQRECLVSLFFDLYHRQLKADLSFARQTESIILTIVVPWEVGRLFFFLFRCEQKREREREK